MTCHHWVKMTRQPVQVIVDPSGEPFPVTSPSEPVGEAVGCEQCGAALTPESILRDCEPILEEEVIA